MYCRTLSESYDQPDCVRIPALDVPAGVAMSTVISDSDDYDAVLPLSVVKSINIYEGTQKAYSNTRCAADSSTRRSNFPAPTLGALVPFTSVA